MAVGFIGVGSGDAVGLGLVCGVPTMCSGLVKVTAAKTPPVKSKRAVTAIIMVFKVFFMLFQSYSVGVGEGEGEGVGMGVGVFVGETRR